MCTKSQLSRLIFIFINSFQLLTYIDSWWQVIWKKLIRIFWCTLKLKCAKFQLSPLIFIFINCHQVLSAIDNCWQLMTANMIKIRLEFLCQHKSWYLLVTNISSLGWFSFSSTFISCYQPLTAVDSWWQLMIFDMKKILLEFLCIH